MQLDLANLLLALKSHFLLLFELGLALALIAASLRVGTTPWLNALWRSWCNLARRPRLAVLVPAVATLALRLLLIPVTGIPQPGMAVDEYSYLLAGDTFASGRLTNPPHPFYKHFESPHIIYQPTYMSKYPPGEGLVLALGEWLGHPWIGVLLSVAALIIAAGWAFQAWLPPPFALLATTMLALRIGVMSYWANSYWGGAVAAMGGALLIGALPRIARRPAPLDGALLGLGLGLLALGRPFEGLVFSAVVLLIWAALWGAPSPWGSLPRPCRGRRRYLSLGPALAGAAVAVALIFGWLGYYHWRVTGDPLQMPYQIWQGRYQSVAFAWDPPQLEYTPPNPTYRLYTEWILDGYHDRKTAVMRWAIEAEILVLFFWGPLLAVFVVAALPWLVKSRRMRLLVLAVPLTLLIVSLSIFTFSHYLAPLTAALTILGVQAVRTAAVVARGRFNAHRRFRLRPNLPLVVLGLPLLLLALNLTGVYLRATDRLWATPTYETGWCCFPVTTERNRVEQMLAAQPGKHLIFLRLPPDLIRGTNWIWTFNAASVDDSKTVWVGEISPEADCQLRRYYSDRDVWLAELGSTPVPVAPFPQPSCRAEALSPAATARSGR